MKRTVGAALILLTFTATACSGSEPARSWSEFESCVNAFGYDSVSFLKGRVEDYREGGYERRGEVPSPATFQCEKVMPFTD